MILWLGKFYLEVYQKEEDKLKLFLFDTKDSDSLLFTMVIGCDRAPVADMSELVLVNVVKRLPSSKEQFLFFDGALKESPH